MRKNYSERIIQEVDYIEAFDGTIFHVNSQISEEEAMKECIKYEDSAFNVVKRRIQDFKIGETSYCYIDGNAISDEEIEIFKPETNDNVKDLMMYMQLQNVDNAKEITFKKNEEVILIWNYDRTWVTVTTLELWVGSITNNYYETIKNYKEKKNG